MASVVLSRQAVADFDQILADLGAAAGPAVAQKYERLFEEVFASLSDSPGRGSPRSRLGRNIRLCLASPYSIYYEGGPDHEVVRIMRLLHGRRRVTRKLLNEGRDT